MKAMIATLYGRIAYALSVRIALNASHRPQHIASPSAHPIAYRDLDDNE
jgi:hypothetical protein